LLSHKTVEKVLHCVQLVAAGRSVSLRNNAHDKMRLRLSLEDLGHGTLGMD
jgi:hypothetical protein